MTTNTIKAKTTKITSLFLALVMMMSAFAGFSITAEAKEWKKSNVLLAQYSGQLVSYENDDEYTITISSLDYVEMVITSNIPMDVDIDPDLYAYPFKSFFARDVTKYTFRFFESRGTFTIRISKGMAAGFNSTGNYKIKFYNRTPKPSVKKLTAQKKAFAVEWGKKSGVTGYQIQYSTDANFRNAKKVTVKGADNTSKKILKLNKGKNYYVRVRTFKTYDGKRYYSSWSAKKTVITK
ncbi:MAG: fibronectin type III domain-containing protein [Eubacterium sp.]|nr:fibronectin type III domain-containing protein [Eubacterium sp.]MBR0412429.1 fibronectin type III domain-containing protein [Eubacterium sp.]